MKKNIDAVGLGWVMEDFLVVLPAYPEVNTKTESITDSVQVGGPVARAMLALSRLGKRTALIARVGDDQRGAFVRSNLRKEGIELGAVEIEKGGKTRFSHVWIEEKTGTRTVAYSRGRLADLKLGSEAKERIKRARILHLDGRETDAALAAAQLAREVGCRVTLDAGSVKPGIDRLIPLVDVIVASSSFIQNFLPGFSLEKAGETLLSMGPKIAIFTCGDRGAGGISENGFFYQPAFPVQVVDTNGAGDAFSGGLLFGLLEDWDIRYSVRFASAVAALKCRHLGNKGLPRLEEVQRFLASFETI